MDIDKAKEINELYSEIGQIDDFIRWYEGKEIVLSTPVGVTHQKLALVGKRKNDMIEVLKSWREECIKEIESM